MGRVIDHGRRFWHWLEGSPGSTRIVQPRARAAEPFVQPATVEAPDLLPAERRAALVAAFNPSHPIRYRQDLRGREAELDALTDAMLQQRQHAIVHGPRGAGKTSLTRIFAHHADAEGAVLIYAAAEATASFADLIRPFLRTVPADNLPIGGDPAYRAELADMGRSFGPQAVASLLGRLDRRLVIFILDEFDRVTDRGVEDQVATLMKLLSDMLAPVQLMVVGIAQSVEGLIECHPSLRRHLTAVSVGPIADREIEHLLTAGAARAGLAFAPDAAALIVEVASGSPYHARLFAYYAGAVALAQDTETGTETETGTIARPHAIAGLRAACRRWAGLNRSDSAIFARLAELPAATRATIGAAVGHVARGDGTGDHRPADREARAALLPLLAGSLVADGDESRPLFRDTTAPQYLLSILKCADEPADRGWPATAELPPASQSGAHGG